MLSDQQQQGIKQKRKIFFEMLRDSLDRQMPRNGNEMEWLK